MEVCCLNFMDEERRAKMTERFNRHGISVYFVDPVYHTDPRMEGLDKRVTSNMLGHLDSIRHFYEDTTKPYAILCEDDILLSKLKGTPSFCMISDSAAGSQRIIATNGVFRLRIVDEVKRLTVFRYLYKKEFTDQFNAYTCGSIMANIKESDLLNHIVIPELIENHMPRLSRRLRQSSPRWGRSWRHW